MKSSISTIRRCVLIAALERDRFVLRKISSRRRQGCVSTIPNTISNWRRWVPCF